MEEYGTPKVDFFVLDTGNPKYLLIHDLSKYYHLKTKPAIIEITVPGSEEIITNYLYKNGYNYFNSVNLRQNCLSSDEELDNLSDGFYKITVKLSPDTFQKTKYYLKTDELEEDFGKILLRVGLDYNPNNEPFMEWFSKVFLFLKAAKASTHNGDISRAKSFYEDAKSLVDKVKKCNNCY